ncbi:MAG: fused MFS/spermidine synthase [Armatimonadota bacterium]|nr:fused MFS/spermidine synthase [Armatimonadota bacterium]MDR7495288.1 fused MFS/spermidine synthase [Armatimonadota bacterium]MDR7505898.1 fused MFS/spermidine synthase [Armatimonadota bacterium]MDR7553852.1 fused MFS/spermidine synthase [Armatimonadota bacterium]MDR7558527.1 fused MFS/spermidine synthase [Armatimonadota bacterium]
MPEFDARPAEFPLKGIWFYDRYTPAEVHAHRSGPVVARARTRYQEVVVQQLEHLGRCLIVDGKIQSAEVDEYIYHELLVHPVLVAHPAPRRVLVCGGGEGAPLREILRHPTIEQVVMVDIDEELVALCREHLPGWHAGAFDDPRVRLRYGDARAFVEETKERFDVVINDVTDPIEGGPSKLLFTREFYQAVARVLAPEGLFVTQAIGVHYDAGDRLHAMIHHTVRQVFPHTRSYCEYILSFDYPWAFVAGARRPVWDDLSAAEVDRRLAQRGLRLRFYDGETHRRVMSLPAPLRRLIAGEQGVISDREPLTVL